MYVSRMQAAKHSLPDVEPSQVADRQKRILIRQANKSGLLLNTSYDPVNYYE
ncbi:hypothetical protein Q0590_16670 [Rhodocytophaga aerolata]|uniref:Uncharacterized protein n=1 Tax=Rhodocytophaga aerolata TaxID=455078 RepID=A0ABT8R746_9BACT|nr:hypothetical protein [Rhodocytophaga aerolata]MDO1447907.1 hypothetical protein [Rhodocytophaga aerolata]